ncbi:MAG: hypothetical protein A4E44_01546 [Methanosaeta sp. PtaB.Bin018]|nr:MAG: hypothetical protein A4E44_01546 [Methanosaeta sp. PtaB.Bin018]
MQNEPAHGVVSANDGSSDVKLVYGRGPDLNLITNIEVSDIANNPHNAIALLGMHDLIEDNLACGCTLNQYSIPDHWHCYYIPTGIDIECLVGCACGLVSTFRPWNALYQVQGLKRLHLVPDRPRIAVYQLCNLLAFYCSPLDAMNVYQCSEYVPLDWC